MSFRFLNEDPSFKGMVRALKEVSVQLSTALFNRVERVHERILDVTQSARCVDIRQLEGKKTEEIQEALSPSIESLLKHSIGVFRDIESLATLGDSAQDMGPAETPHLRFELVIDQVVDGEQEEINTALQDLSFIAIFELNQRAQRLKQIQHSSPGWLLLEEYDSALRRIIKALTAAELLLAGILGKPAQLDFTTELLVALRIRKTYAKLRVFVGSGAPSPENILTRLRGIGTRIAMLVGHDIYPSLRIQDRRQLRKLQQRLLSWLRGESDFQYSEASHLWQDIQSCVFLFGRISSRQELIEHDIATVETLLTHLLKNGAPSLLDTHKEALNSLAGLDDEVDGLLNTAPTIAQWRSCLLKLQSNFRAAPS